MHQSALINPQEGFTLAETAIVLAILALVMGALIPSYLSLRLAEQARITAQNMQTVMRSIAGFVQSSGCLPCPLAADEIDVDISACGDCKNSVGVVPFRLLGLPQSFAKDAYGHWLTYAVDRSLARLPDFNQPRSKTNDICSHPQITATQLSVKPNIGGPQENISVLLLSHGANGYGAYKNQPDDVLRLGFPSSAKTCDVGFSGAEKCNADDVDFKFVAALPAQGSDPFDDVMLYFDRNALVTYLGNLPCGAASQ